MMKIQRKTLVSTVTLLALLIPNAYAEMAGRVLTAVGDVSAERGGQRIRLTQGAIVEAGDVLTTGETSNVQVRFTDESIVALRPNTSLAVKSYRFDRKPESDSMVLGLVKGGMRTITGLVGKLNRDSYMVEAPTATIGIRGTHYTLVSCANDCNNSDGSKAQNGTFGGVTEGRIAVTNNSGQKEFGREEYFFVASRDSAPQPLLTPPTFLRDRLEGQAKSSGKGKEAPATQVAQTATKSDEAVAAAAVVASAPASAPSTVTAPAVYVPAEQQAVVATTVNPFMGYTDFAVVTESSDASTLDLPVTERLAEIDRYKSLLADSLIYSRDLGSSSVGEMRWGRWTGADDPRGTYSGMGEHWSVGIPTPDSAWPTSGVYTFTHLGGTNPTDNLGHVGTVQSGGSFSIDFTRQTGKTLTPIQWAVGGNSYSLSINTLYLSSSSTASDVYSLSCGSCTSPTAEVSGHFTGTTVQGALLGIYTTADFAGVIQETGQVRAYAGKPDSGTTPTPNPNPTPNPTPTPTPACTSYPCTHGAGLAFAAASIVNNVVNGDASAYTVTVTAPSASADMPVTPVTIATAFDGGSTTTGSVINTGTSTVANLSWGRMEFSSTYVENGVNVSERGTGHFLTGDALVALPTSGAYTFRHLGGTTPTDQNGNAGVLNSAGSWAIDFASRTAATASDVNWTVDNVTYNLRVPTQQWTVTSFSTTTPTGTAIKLDMFDTTGPANVLTCSPSCVVPTGSDTGNQVSGVFMGANAQALGMSYSTNVQVNGVNKVTAHVQGYGRP